MGGGKQRSEGEGGPESEGEVRGGRGGAWRHRGVEEEPGRLGGRRWRLRARWRRHASAYWQRWKKTKAPLVGWADSAGPPGEWASGKRQVSPSLSLSFICFSFLFLLLCFELVKILTHFIKSRQKLWALFGLFPIAPKYFQDYLDI